MMYSKTDIKYTWTLWINFRQFKLLTWTSFIGSSSRKEGDEVKRVDEYCLDTVDSYRRNKENSSRNDVAKN